MRLDHAMANTDEIPLEGGNTNTVVRVADTVRRQPSKHSATHHRLLDHLAGHGFDAAPRFLGQDTKGRDILTFLEGDTGFPADMWTNNAPLVAAASLLKRYHAATVGFATEGATWAQQNTPAEVICHNDFAPYNMVFRDGLPYAIIDFDVCGPGPRLRDLAYLAYWMVPLSFAADDLASLTRVEADLGYPRLRLLCETYGTDDLDGVLTWIGKTLDTLASFTAMEQSFDRATAKKLQTDGHLAHWQREAEAFRAALPDLRKSLR